MFLRILPFVALVLAGAPALVGAGENYAFLVAVADYDRTQLNPLDFTQRDVLDFAQALEAAGYARENLVLLHDRQDRRYVPERAKVRRELELLLDGLRPDDSLIVAFSGHGVRFGDDAASYFCPIDARLDDRSTLIKLEDVYAEVARCPAKKRLLLIDACRNDPQSTLARSRRVVELESLSRPEREVLPEGIVALFSCAAGQQSYEHPQLNHGVFFHHVLQGFQGAADDGDGELTLDELVSFARKRTQDFARRELAVSQTPFLKGEFSGSWTLRTLHAAPGAVTPQTPAAPAPQRDKAALEAEALAAEGKAKEAYVVAEDARLKALAASEVKLKEHTAKPPFDITGRWFAKGESYYLEHEFLADGRCQWWMKDGSGGQLAHWSGRYEFRDGHYVFTGDASYPGSHSKCTFEWHDANLFSSSILTSSHAQLIGASHRHYRTK